MENFKQLISGFQLDYPRIWQALSLIGDAVDKLIVQVNNLLGEVAPQCRAYRTTNQAIADITPTAISMDATYGQTTNIHDNVNSPTRFTITINGSYEFGACVEFESSAAGSFRSLSVLVTRDGVSTEFVKVRVPPVNGASTILNVHSYTGFSINDYLEFVVEQDSGGALNIIATLNYSPQAWIDMLNSRR